MKRLYAIQTLVAYVFVFAVGCQPSEFEAEHIEHEQSPIASHFSGEDFYRGMVLQHGPVAAVVPEIRDQLHLKLFVAEPGRFAKIVGIYDALIAQIYREQPQFFDKFKADMQSGNRERIQASIEAAAVFTREIASRTPELGPAHEQLSSGASPNGPVEEQTLEELRKNRAGIDVYRDTIVILFNFAVTSVYEYVHLFNYVIVATKFWIGAGVKGASLVRERVVDSVATMFAVR